MGAKRSVQGRSRGYDELLLDWQRANNPNFVEPVKRETKAEKKEKREREKLEKKRLADAALGIDPASLPKKSGAPGAPKKSNKKATAAAVRLRQEMDDEASDDLEQIDSEAELDHLSRAVRTATEKGIICNPLAVPCDVGSWFIQRRERARCCRDLLISAFGIGGVGAGGMNGVGVPSSRTPGLANNMGAKHSN